MWMTQLSSLISVPIGMVMISVPIVHGLSLNITALSASNGASTLECWQMDTPFSISSESGTAGTASLSLGSLTNLTYTVIPAAFDGGLHNAPSAQWVLFVSGLAQITLPTNDTSEAYISGGEYGIIFAADTADLSTLGHRTQYPGTTETVAIELPTEDGDIPAHQVLHSGPCTAKDFVGLKSLATGSS